VESPAIFVQISAGKNRSLKLIVRSGRALLLLAHVKRYAGHTFASPAGFKLVKGGKAGGGKALRKISKTVFGEQHSPAFPLQPNGQRSLPKCAHLVLEVVGGRANRKENQANIEIVPYNEYAVPCERHAA
jgi:hypothetical protein